MKLIFFISCIFISCQAFSLLNLLDNALSYISYPRDNRGRKRVFLREDKEEKKGSKSSENASSSDTGEDSSNNCSDSNSTKSENPEDDSKKLIEKYDKLFNSTINETRIKMFFLNLTHTNCKT